MALTKPPSKRRETKTSEPKFLTTGINDEDESLVGTGVVYVRAAPEGTQVVLAEGVKGLELSHLISYMDDATPVAWTYCGGCGNYIGRCDCRWGVSAPKYIEYLCGPLVTHQTNKPAPKKPKFGGMTPPQKAKKLTKPRNTRRRQEENLLEHHPKLTRPKKAARGRR